MTELAPYLPVEIGTIISQPIKGDIRAVKLVIFIRSHPSIRTFI